jgi:hypothetical protein
VRWHAGLVGGGDVACGSLSVVLGCWMVVVSGRDMMGQCLATGGCQTLKLLIINNLIFNSHVNSIKNLINTPGTGFQLQSVLVNSGEHSGINSGVVQIHQIKKLPEWKNWQASLPIFNPPDSTGLQWSLVTPSGIWGAPIRPQLLF